jgi:hypothetical protein
MKIVTKEGKEYSNFEVEESVALSIGNVEKMLHLNSAKLYSYPLRTAIQEYLSNAKDAHSENNICLSKMEITAPTFNNPVINIKDYGLGMSKEDVLKVFLPYGSSSKDKDDKSIGGFGIGGMSWLAVNNNFSVVAVKNGTKVIYNVSKLGEMTAGKADLWSEETVDEPNSVELILPLASIDQITDAKNFINRIIKHWKVEPKLENMEIDKGDILKETDDYILYRGYKEFHSYNKREKDFVLLGGIEYNLEDMDCRDKFVEKFGDLRIILKFNVGDFIPHHKREILINDTKTNKAISIKIEKINKEIIDFFKKKLKIEKVQSILGFLKSQYGKRNFNEINLEKENIKISFEKRSYGSPSMKMSYKNRFPEKILQIRNKVTQSMSSQEKTNNIMGVVLNDKELKKRDLYYGLSKRLMNNQNGRGHNLSGYYFLNELTKEEESFLKERFTLIKTSELTEVAPKSISSKNGNRSTKTAITYSKVISSEYGSKVSVLTKKELEDNFVMDVSSYRDINHDAILRAVAVITKKNIYVIAKNNIKNATNMGSKILTEGMIKKELIKCKSTFRKSLIVDRNNIYKQQLTLLRENSIFMELLELELTKEEEALINELYNVYEIYRYIGEDISKDIFFNTIKEISEYTPLIANKVFSSYANKIITKEIKVLIKYFYEDKSIVKKKL